MKLQFVLMIFFFGAFPLWAKPKHPWPILNPKIGNNMQTFQGMGGPEKNFWHQGLDILTHSHAPVFLSAPGKVTAIVNGASWTDDPDYWRIEVQDEEGLIWKYVHLVKESINEEVYHSLERGTLLSSGTFLGNVVSWGDDYNHIHLEVTHQDGSFINPLLVLEPLNDTSSPEIHEIGLVVNHQPLSAKVIKGNHALYVKTSDLILHDTYLVPPHRISYSLNDGPWVMVWEFNFLPSGGQESKFVDDFFLPSTCVMCGGQKNEFYINLLFSTSNPRAEFEHLEPGPQKVKVRVEDLSGNFDEKSFVWTVLD
jgi:hypothetical protein